MSELAAKPPRVTADPNDVARARLLAQIEAKEQELEADRERTSRLVSDRVRAVSAGVLAMAWGFIIEPDFLPARQMVGPVVLAFLTLLIDFLQYFVGYLDSSGRRRRLIELRKQVAAGGKPTDVGSSAWPHRLRGLRLACFFGKIVTFVAALAWLITVMTLRLLEDQQDDAASALALF